MFFNRIRKEKEKSCAVDALDNRQTERTPRKCFKCGYGDPLIAKHPKPPKDNEKRQKKVLFNEKGNLACDNGEKTATKRYIYLWHVCLAMTNVLVRILVTVRN